MAVGDYGDAGRRKLDRLRQELGLDYRDPNSPSRESRTRSELVGYEEPIVRDIPAPEDQDMWSEESLALPPPSEVLIVKQAYGAKVVTRKTSRYGLTYKRPDLDPTAYEQGSGMRSTRVWGMQWIPTTIMTEEPQLGDNNSPQTYLSGYDINSLTSESVFGDVLVAFARPSNLQPNSLYVFSYNTLSAWESFRGASSFGRAVRTLNGGRPFKDSDNYRYASLHPAVSDSDWIFGSTYMSMWSTTREVSAAGSTMSIGGIERIFGKEIT